MSPRLRTAMAVLATLSLWSLAFLFGVVTERMRASCDQHTTNQDARAVSLADDREDGR